tara:strand:- start:3362 stop:4129 length:768 start_codon:yes stop_codon:yes gene_type:complete
MKNKCLSKHNKFYRFSKIYENTNLDDYKNKIITIFVTEGKIEIEINKKIVEVHADQGILISSKSNISSINLIDNAILYEVVSEKKTENLIEFVDNGTELNEEEIIYYKILDNHKKVEKPWGYELWIIWLKDYHVLKKIFMKKNFKCSLQFHREKYETNYILSGKARIINNFHVGPKAGIDETQKKIENIDLLKDYSKEINAPYSFSVMPGEVHRIYSIEDYISYEVSTPQLDDVIRIQDDYKRKSGRIVSEHKNK